MQKYNVQVDNQIHKIKVDSLFPIRFANTILSQLPRTCFTVLVILEYNYHNITSGNKKFKNIQNPKDYLKIFRDGIEKGGHLTRLAVQEPLGR